MIGDQIGMNIAKIRKGKGISQEKLAENVNISLSTLKRMEKGTGTYGIEILEAIAKELEVPLHQIVPAISESWEVLQKIYGDKNEDVESEFDQISIFYPKGNNPYHYQVSEAFQITNLMQFMLYLPLFSWDELADVLANSIKGEINGNEYYICEKIDSLYENIECKEAKEYADLLCQELTYDFQKNKYATLNEDIMTVLKKSLMSDESERGRMEYEKRLDVLVKNFHRGKSIEDDN